jgi:hypothetical protein
MYTLGEILEVFGGNPFITNLHLLRNSKIMFPHSRGLLLLLLLAFYEPVERNSKARGVWLANLRHLTDTEVSTFHFYNPVRTLFIEKFEQNRNIQILTLSKYCKNSPLTVIGNIISS